MILFSDAAADCLCKRTLNPLTCDANHCKALGHLQGGYADDPNKPTSPLQQFSDVKLDPINREEIIFQGTMLCWASAAFL